MAPPKFDDLINQGGKVETKKAAPVRFDDLVARGAKPLETVQPAPDNEAQPAPESRKPGVLSRSLQLGLVYPGAGLASLASPLFDLAGAPGYGETFDDMRDGAESGYTMGFNDELAGAAGMAAGKDYGATRDAKRAEDRAAQARSGKAYFLGSLTGGAAVPFPGGSGANAGRMALARTLGQGALGGVGMSEGDSAEDIGLDALKGAGVGLVTHGALQGGGQLLKAGQPVLRRVMDNFAVGQGRRALTNGADSLSAKNLVRDDAVREAIDSNAILPNGTTAGALGRLDRLAEELGAGYGATVERLRQLGVKGPEAQALAEKMRRRAAEIRPNTTNEAIPEEFERRAQQVMSKPQFSPKPTGTPNRYVVTRDRNLRLDQNEALKRSMQEQARYGEISETPLNEAKREIASIYRQGTEDAIDAAAAANPGSEIEHLAEGFVPIKRRLGNAIEARDAALRGTQRGGQRGFFSFADKVAMAASPDPATALAKGVLGKVWSSRGPSTVAWAARNLGESRAIGDGLRASPLWLGRSTGAVTNAERDAVIEWLRAKKADEQQ